MVLHRPLGHPSTAALRARLIEVRDKYTWAPGRVLAGQPSRVTADRNSGVICEALRERALKVEREMLIESPYLVLGERPIDVVRQLTALGR